MKPVLPSLATPAAAAATRRPVPTAPPKTSFPDAHVPFLLTKIEELDTGNLTFIVESVYKELKSLQGTVGVPAVKKNAIEAKVKEVGEKDRKVWIVRPEIKVSFVNFLRFVRVGCSRFRLSRLCMALLEQRSPFGGRGSSCSRACFSAVEKFVYLFNAFFLPFFLYALLHDVMKSLVVSS